MIGRSINDPGIADFQYQAHKSRLVVDNSFQASRVSFKDIDENVRTVAVAARISPLCPA